MTGDEGGETAARKHTSDALRRSDGKGTHAVRLCSAPGRCRARTDDRVDVSLGVGPNAASLLHSKGEEPVVGVASEHEVTVLTDLAGALIR